MCPGTPPVCEIFQWKVSLENIVTNWIDYFSEKEKVNIGEEIADVFIYSTRLSDICNIDLAYVVEQSASNIREMLIKRFHGNSKY